MFLPVRVRFPAICPGQPATVLLRRHLADNALSERPFLSCKEGGKVPGRALGEAVALALVSGLASAAGVGSWGRFSFSREQFQRQQGGVGRLGCEAGTEVTMPPETFHLELILGVRKVT